MNIIEYIKAVLFGIVEGITEWLPISSTGHMILLNEFIKMDVSKEFWDMFLVVVQLGAILAVLVIFWNKIFPFDMHHFKAVPSPKKDILLLWVKILIACVPAGIVGVLFDDVFDKYFYNYVAVAIALIVFGIGFIMIEQLNKGKQSKVNSIADITYTTALLIGIFQLLAAIFPGTSRSGATILGALLIGVSRTVAAEFTFYLAIPVMAGASLLKLLKFGFSFTLNEFVILFIGMIVAYVVSVLVIRFLMNFIKKHNFEVFGWYRIVLGAIILAYFFLSR